MGYTAPETKRYGFQIDETNGTILNTHDATVSTPDNGTETTVKQWTLSASIFSGSELRLIYEHRVTSTGSGELVTTKVYHNATLLDTETHNDTAWEQVIVDIDSITWVQGDIITITQTVTNVAGAYNGQIKEARLYAHNTPFYITV